MKKAFGAVAGVLALAVLFTFLLFWAGEVKTEKPKQLGKQPSQTMDTLNTTRIGSDNPIETAVAVSNMVYPVTEEENSPGAVILVNKNNLKEVLAAARAQHFPVNAPLLYVNEDSMPDKTKEELKRLKPEGVPMDNNVQVYLMGSVQDSVIEEVENLGYKTRSFRTDNAIELTAKIDKWAAAIHGDHENTVIIANYDKPEPAIPSAFWNAHMGNGFAYVTNEGIPEETKRMLKNTANGPWIYVFGDESVISKETVRELASYGHVTRIKGSDVAETSSYFAGFKDTGENWGAWLWQDKRDFGWGIAEAGHNAIFANINGPEGWQNVLPATTLSHMGKHAPLLAVEENSIPSSVSGYLDILKPYPTSVNQQLVNHGWIIGGNNTISEENQVNLDQKLEAYPSEQEGS